MTLKLAYSHDVFFVLIKRHLLENNGFLIDLRFPRNGLTMSTDNYTLRLNMLRLISSDYLLVVSRQLNTKAIARSFLNISSPSVFLAKCCCASRSKT